MIPSRTKHPLPFLFRRLLSFLLLATTCGFADDWKLVFEEDFDQPGWEQRWQFSGGTGDLKSGALTSGGGEFTATLSNRFDAPALRVEYDASMKSADAGGQFSDLSCFIGPVLFQFGGGFNSLTQIKHDTTATGDLGPRIVPGKTHRVVAELNGQLCRLAVDGKPAGQLLLSQPPTSRQIRLYAWAGTAQFDNLRVFTRAEADPLPAELKQQLAYGHETPQTLKHLRDWPLPKFAKGKAANAKRERIALRVDYGPETKPGMTWPITCGVPLSRDVLFDPDQARVVDERGQEIPSQRTVTATWSEGGSIRWLLLDFLLPVKDKPPKLFLEYGRKVRAATPKNPVRVTETADQFTVSSGKAEFVVSRKRGTVFESASFDKDNDGAYGDDERVLGASEAYYTTTKGWHFRTGVEDGELDVKVEMAGPVRSVIRSRGWYKDEKGKRACYFTRRLHIYKDLSWARLVTTWTVTGDTRAYTFTDVGVRFPLANPRPDEGPMSVVATDRGKSLVISGDRREERGEVESWLQGGGVTLGCYEMARQWPAALERTERELVFHAFSNKAGLDLDLSLGGLKTLWGEKVFAHFEAGRGMYPSINDRNPSGLGIAKTHELIVALDDDSARAEPIARTFQQPPLVSADPVHVCATGVVGPGEYHPYDPKNFAREEKVIEQERDRLFDALDRVTPWYGWWDYGAGVPHHMQGVEGDGPVTYSGYRRGYDMGYGQPLVPWMMYLRSGQRPWLAYAIRNARCMMDARTQHWTDPIVNKHVGWSVQDHGTWAWDTLLAEWGFNYFAPFMLLDYYTTGYERAMDVHTEVLDEFCRSGRAYYVASIGVWMGNCAAAFRATWEPQYLAKFKELQKQMLDCRCSLCGGMNNNPDTKDEDHDSHGTIHRDGWVEYGIVEGSQLGEHFESSLLDVLVREGQRRVENQSAANYSVMGYTRLLAYRATKDPRIAKEGAELLERFTTPPAQSFTSFCGPSHARHLPVLMKLALVPGLDKIEIPTSRAYPTPLFVQHREGRETVVTIVTKQKVSRAETKVNVLGPDGKPVAEELCPFDPILGTLTLRVPGSAESGVYRIIGPERQRLTIRHMPSTPVAIAVPEGYGHENAEPMDKLWFSVPKGVKQFRIRNNVEERKLTVTRPDGKRIVGSGEWHTIEVPEGLAGSVWSVESDANPPSNFQVLKFYDIPAVVALSRESLFVPADPPATAPDYASRESQTPFLNGGFAGSQAVLIRGHDQLRIPLGEKTGPSSRQRFNAARGTIEFFFQLNENPFFANAAGLPLRLAPDDSAKFDNWVRRWFLCDWKNAVLFLTPDGRVHDGDAHRFGPWEPQVGMIDLKPGVWYHLAVQWDADKEFAVGSGTRRKSQVRVFLNGRNRSNQPWYDHPDNLLDSYAAPLPAPMLEMLSEGHHVLFDELRVSDIERVPFRSLDDRCPVPTRPYEPDAHTLLLMHFDGDVQGEGRNGDRFNANFKPGP